MDGDIQFGEVQQARPGRRRRPDRDRHFVVCDCGSPSGGDLPIFVDVDVLAEIEAHAHSDTRVELGGVLLGGQFEDQEGNPFVLVLDSLRAEHYQSSGSHFKFTHDTWTQITRQRDGFSDDLEMVGWYHTHPNLGVFLSSMDRFICEHFFNRPLDVALVVDPLRGDRGWFYWGDGGQRLPRAKGFGVIASRFRRQELAAYVELLKEDTAMTTERLAGGLTPGAELRLPQQVIHTIRPQLGWIGAAVLAMLVLQVCTTLLVALRLGSPAATQRVPDRPAASGEPIAAQEVAAEMALREQRLAAREGVFQDLLGRVEVGADGSLNVGSLVEDYKRLRQEVDQGRKTDLLLGEAAKWIDQDRRQLQAKVRGLEESNQELTTGNERLLAKIAKLEDLREADKGAAQEEIAQLKKQVAQATGEDLEEDNTTWIGSWTTMVAAVVGLLIVAALAAVILVLRCKKRASRAEV
jgi:proteasome lid subunit RPN8/RPN11